MAPLNYLKGLKKWKELGPYSYIAIEGNIGAGKTSLSEMVARDLEGKLVLEQFPDNPFLPKFYENREKYAFPLEMSFLAGRFQQLSDELLTADLFSQLTVSDYFVLKSLIFAEVNLPHDEFELYRRIFDLVVHQIPGPELLVYLHRDVDSLQRQIRKRGRSYEQRIPDSYLEAVQQSYFRFLRQQGSLSVVVVELGSRNFVSEVDLYREILKKLKAYYPKGLTILAMD